MPQAENFSIVVLGGMNPRVHSPFFYRAINAITEDELQASHLRDSTMVLPQLAQLDLADDVRVMCLPDRWQITSPTEARTARLLEVATMVHRALDHTPVGAFGFNYDFVRAVPGDTEARFAELARTLPVGFAGDGAASANFSYSTRADEGETRRRTTVVVAPLTDPAEHVLVKNNYNHEILPAAGPHYDLGAFMQARFARDLESARAQVARTVQRLGAH